MKEKTSTAINKNTIFSSPFIFKDIEEKEIQSALELSEYRLEIYRSGEKIYDCESFEDSIAFILDGDILVYRAHSEKRTLLTKLKSGDSFGAAALFGNNEGFPTAIYAKTDSKVMFICQEKMELLIRSFPQIAINYVEFLSGRIRFLNDKIHSFTSRSAEEKTAKFLLSNCEGDKLKSSLNMTQISSSLGIGRASLYRILSAFEDIGAIDRKNSEIIIKDKEKIKNILKEKETKK